MKDADLDRGGHAPGAQTALSRVKRLLPFALFALALAFVVHKVPMRDLCGPVGSPPSQLVPTTRDAASCTQYLPSGEVAVPLSECQKFTCEPGAISTVRGAHPWWLLLAAVVYGAGTLAWAARWRMLLGFAGVKLTVAGVWRMTAEAQAMGIVLPGGLGGDALRIASVIALPPDETIEPRSRADQITVVVTSVLLDRAIGLTAIGTVAAIAGFAAGGGGGTAATGVLALFPVAFVAGVILLQHPGLQTMQWLFETRVGARLRPLVQYLGDKRAPRAIAKGFATSLLVSTASFVAIRLIVIALGGRPTDETWIYVGAAMAMMIGALPLAPGGWGTTDAAYVAFLAKAGLPASIALGVSLLFRLFWYGMALVGGLLYMSRKRKARAVSG